MTLLMTENLQSKGGLLGDRPRIMAVCGPQQEDELRVVNPAQDLELKVLYFRSMFACL